MAEKGKEVAKRKPGLLEVMGAKYNIDPAKLLQVVKATVMKPGKDGRIATDEEVMALMIVANKYDLDPFTGEISAFPNKKGGIIPFIGIDGYVRKICNHSDFGGIEIEFADDEVTPEGGKQCPEWCEIKLYRKGIGKPIVVREYIDEVYIPARSGFVGPWQTHTKRMLRHKAIIQAGRVAGFMTGVYDEDEARRILDAEAIETAVTMKPAIEMPQPKSVAEDVTKDKKDTEEEQAAPISASSSPEQQKAIHTLVIKLVKEKRWKDQSRLYDILGKDYSVESTKHLTSQQASGLIERLSKELNGKQ